MPAMNATRLAHYLETGELPPNRYLTEWQRTEVAHAPADERTRDLAERIGADYFLTVRYRYLVTGVLASRLYYRSCSVCGESFVTRYSKRHMHTECRQGLNWRWEMAVAA